MVETYVNRQTKWIQIQIQNWRYTVTKTRTFLPILIFNDWIISNETVDVGGRDNSFSNNVSTSFQLVILITLVEYWVYKTNFSKREKEGINLWFGKFFVSKIRVHHFLSFKIRNQVKYLYMRFFFFFSSSLLFIVNFWLLIFANRSFA